MLLQLKRNCRSDVNSPCIGIGNRQHITIGRDRRTRRVERLPFRVHFRQTGNWIPRDEISRRRRTEDFLCWSEDRLSQVTPWEGNLSTTCGIPDRPSSNQVVHEKAAMIGRQPDIIDPSLSPVQFAFLVGGCRIPDCDDAVRSRDSQPLAVWRESGTARVARQLELLTPNESAGIRIPQSERPGTGFQGDQGPTVGCECECGGRLDGELDMVCG